MKKIINLVLGLGLIVGLIVGAKYLLDGINNELAFHNDMIVGYKSHTNDENEGDEKGPGLTLSINDRDSEGRFRLLGSFSFIVKLDKKQFDNYLSEMTDLQKANNDVIVEFDMENSNLFGENIKLDNSKDYYDGSTFYEFREEFVGVINFNEAEVYLEIPDKFIKEDGRIRDDYRFEFFLRFKGVLYNLEGKTNEFERYTDNHIKHSYKAIKDNNYYFLVKAAAEELTNEKVEFKLTILDKLLNLIK